MQIQQYEYFTITEVMFEYHDNITWNLTAKLAFTSMCKAMRC